MASTRSRSGNVCETATLIFAVDEESKVEISDSDADLPLSHGKNEPIYIWGSSNEEVKQQGWGSRNFAGGMLEIH